MSGSSLDVTCTSCDGGLDDELDDELGATIAMSSCVAAVFFASTGLSARAVQRFSSGFDLASLEPDGKTRSAVVRRGMRLAVFAPSS